MYATLSLFGGIIFYKGIDYVVHLLEGDAHDHDVDIDLYDLDGSSSANSPHRNASAAAAARNSSGVAKDGAFAETGTFAVAPSGGADSMFPATEKSLPRKGANDGGGDHRSHSAREFPHEHNVVVELSSGTTVRPSPDLHTLQLSMAGKVHQHPDSPVSALTPESKMDMGDDLAGVEEGAGGESAARAAAGAAGGAVADGDNQKLVRMGVMTAVAIGIHNFPEGLATFVAALSDPSVGLALAVAIAIHNIPEGLCVAIPVYYATGNRWKAFGWALLSGVSEPIGAALGWLVLKDIMSELVYGILFGVVAGMMVNITIHELIPTAVRYDPADKVTTNSIIAGMAIMALSLTLFLY